MILKLSRTRVLSYLRTNPLITIFFWAHFHRSWLSARGQLSPQILCTPLTVHTWWWLLLPAKRKAWTLQVCNLFPPIYIYIINVCAFSCLKFHYMIPMFDYRSPRFILDTCMWCWWNEQNTQRKVCWTLRGPNIGECKVSSLIKVLQLWWKTTDFVIYLWLVVSYFYTHWCMIMFDDFFCFTFLQLLESFQKSFPTLNFPPLPERGDFDLRDVLESPYFFN